MAVLIVGPGSAQDPCIELVTAAIDERGGQAHCIDTGRFPSALSLSAISGSVASEQSIGDIPTNVLSGIWVRDLRPGRDLPGDMRPDFRRASIAMSHAALAAWLDSVSTFCLDRPSTLARVPGKVGQSRLAAATGLRVPKTLLTNDPETVRSFYESCEGNVVCKMINSSVLVGSSDEAEPVYTRALTEDDLADIEGLRLCPMLFQENVPKARELRITAVGTQLFTASVDPTQSARGADDWRRDSALVDAFAADELPSAVADRISTLLDRLGLNFASIDMIRTPDDQHVFLELNTVSYFDFVERAAGLPISGAVADLLLGNTEGRTSRP